MDPKDSDQLFRERLGSFSQAPEPEVWDRIRASLDRKKSRRVLPIWWYGASAAAILILGLLLWNPWGPGGEIEPLAPAISDTETRTAPEQPDTGTLPIETLPESGVTQQSSTEEVIRETPATQKPLSPGVPRREQVTQAPAREPGASRIAGAQLAVSEAQEATDPNEVASEIVNNTDRDIDETSIDATRTAPITTRNTDQALLAQTQADKAAESPKDSLVENQKRSLFEVLEEQEEAALTQTENTQGKWSVGPSLAPVYSNAFGDGSPISPNFAPNNKSGTVHMSYGLEVAYAVSDRVSFRSGVHRVDYGYNTNDVAFTSTMAVGPSSLIRTISYSENAKTLVVQSTAGSDASAITQNAMDVDGPSPQREGRMEQSFAYLEVPLEMEYRVLTGRWGINIIGGVSSLFLTDNAVRLNADGGTTELGEATNMNSVNFSTNFGLGFTYDLSPAMQLRMQPMFKYQLNTFSDTAGNFQPYALGVYSGMRFRF
ncbi:hypothetical protein OZ410_03825 [Robiginitalea sp. M366]|uniref:hypothetical protein n=1 Tax=Robiginitalea aestuariiviva TaxID=3036903 RepID=UPI00240E5AB5|nr:hypothetical protein [Robiginitalea aestuariiviva]MDG1571430.1 hypothetical protein [Robiginitalea aestuariiviva]